MPVAETAGVRRVVPRDGGGWRKLGAALPILGPKDAPLAVIARDGRGTVVLLADASPLQNRALGVADNAAFGLNARRRAARSRSSRPSTATASSAG